MANSLPKRSATGQLLPGNTAAPAGKPRAKRTPREVLKAAATDEELIEMVSMGKERALGGDDVWLGWWLNRMFGTARPESAPVVIDGFDAANPVQSSVALTNAAASGKASVSQVRDFVACLKDIDEMGQMADFKAQMEEMREMLAKP
ncbi:MAG: hypothetical protein ABJN62_09725 [Halioglobus sp.]